MDNAINHLLTTAMAAVKISTHAASGYPNVSFRVVREGR